MIFGEKRKGEKGKAKNMVGSGGNECAVTERAKFIC